MGMKEKLIGLVLVILGLWPVILKIGAVAEYVKQYSFLTYLTPGELVYQAIIVVAGLLLLISMRKMGRGYPPGYAYPRR